MKFTRRQGVFAKFNKAKFFKKVLTKPLTRVRIKSEIKIRSGKKKNFHKEGADQ